MRVEQAVVETDGMSYLVLVVDGCDWRVGPELKGTLLMDGVVPVCVDRGAEPYAEIPANPANGRPHVERAAGLCDDPIVSRWLRVTGWTCGAIRSSPDQVSYRRARKRRSRRRICARSSVKS